MFWNQTSCIWKTILILIRNSANIFTLGMYSRNSRALEGFVLLFNSKQIKVGENLGVISPLRGRKGGGLGMAENLILTFEEDILVNISPKHAPILCNHFVYSSMHHILIWSQRQPFYYISCLYLPLQIYNCSVARSCRTNTSVHQWCGCTLPWKQHILAVRKHLLLYT